MSILRNMCEKMWLVFEEQGIKIVLNIIKYFQNLLNYSTTSN